MASIFDGLGAGLGAAASGFLGGQLKGEQMLYDRQRKADDAALRKLAIQARKKELDPTADIRKRAGMTAQMLTQMRADPKMQAFYMSPQGRNFARQLEETGQKYWDVHLGRIGPEEVDVYALSFAPGGEPEGEAPERAAAGAVKKLPFLREPGSSVASFEGTPLPAGSAGTSVLAPPVAGRAAPPEPETAMARYLRLQNNPPRFEPQPGMMPEQIDREQRRLFDEWQAQLNDAYRAVTLEDEAAIKGNQRITTGVEAGNARERGRLDIIGKTEDIKKTRAETGLAKATTPIKVAQGKATLEKTRKDTEAIPKRLEYEGRRTAATESQARTSAGQLELAKQREARLAAQAKKSLETKAVNEEDRRLKERIQTNFRFLTEAKKGYMGSETDRFSVPRQEQARKQLEADLARRSEILRGSRGASAGTPAPKGTKTFMGKPYTWQKFLTEGRSRGKGDTDLKSAWARLPGG